MGTGAGLFEVKLIGDEYFTFVTECKDPKACTILLRGASKEILAVRTTLALLHLSLCCTLCSATLFPYLQLVFCSRASLAIFQPLSAAVPSLT